MKTKVCIIIFISFFGPLRSFGQHFKITEISFEAGGGQFANQNITNLNQINKVTKNGSYHPIGFMANNLQVNFYSWPVYYAGYFVRFQSDKPLNQKSDWAIGLTFNSASGGYSFGGFTRATDSNYYFSIQEKRSYTNLGVEKSFYGNWRFNKVRYTYGLGMTVGHSYTSNYQFFESKSTFNDSLKFTLNEVSQTKTFKAYNNFRANQYLLLGFQVKLNDKTKLDVLFKTGFFQTLGNYAVKNQGFYGFGMLRANWLIQIK